MKFGRVGYDRQNDEKARQQFEYKFLLLDAQFLHTLPKRDAVQDFSNLGLDGWELVQIGNPLAIFKRGLAP